MGEMPAGEEGLMSAPPRLPAAVPRRARGRVRVLGINLRIFQYRAPLTSKSFQGVSKPAATVAAGKNVSTGAKDWLGHDIFLTPLLLSAGIRHTPPPSVSAIPGPIFQQEIHGARSEKGDKSNY
jgi:hypothetical protein